MAAEACSSGAVVYIDFAFNWWMITAPAHRRYLGCFFPSCYAKPPLVIPRPVQEIRLVVHQLFALCLSEQATATVSLLARAEPENLASVAGTDPGSERSRRASRLFISHLQEIVMRLTEDKLFLVFEAVAGSKLYGTDTPASDTDIRGVVIPPIQVYFGTQRFEQLETKNPDRVLYSIDKAVKLVAACNPNMIELLYTPQEYVHFCHPFWQVMIDNRHLFLSKKARHTFSGYAFSQLKRIKDRRRWLECPPTKPDRAGMGLPPHTREFNEDHLQALRVLPRELVSEDKRELVRLELAYSAAQKEWKSYERWLRERNLARLKIEKAHGLDLKHAMHLVRLLRMGEEILSTGEVIVDRRGRDAKELKSILNGAWTYEQITSYAEEMDAKLAGLYETSLLRHAPAHLEIEGLLMGIFGEHFGLSSLKTKEASRDKSAD